MSAPTHKNCAEAWAPPMPVHRCHDRPHRGSVELYAFGSLIVIWLANNTIELFVVDCPSDPWAKRRAAP